MSVDALSFEHFFQLFLLGAFGALALEFLKLREIYGKESVERFQLLIRCPLLWIFSGLLVVLSGLFAWIAHNGEPADHAITMMLAGAGFRSLGREGLGALVHNQGLVQGGGDRLTLRDILR